jgi:hypothetical protein
MDRMVVETLAIVPQAYLPKSGGQSTFFLVFTSWLGSSFIA